MQLKDKHTIEDHLHAAQHQDAYPSPFLHKKRDTVSELNTL